MAFPNNSFWEIVNERVAGANESTEKGINLLPKSLKRKMKTQSILLTRLDLLFLHGRTKTDSVGR